MFTGIIEETGVVENVVKSAGNIILSVRSGISQALKVDESVTHDGVCLTVTKVTGNSHQVEIIEETLAKSNLGQLREGDLVNLERAMLLTSRLDGHLVQGHVDATATCIRQQEMGGSRQFRFRFPNQFAHLVIEKGSICLNGISLTVFDVSSNEFTVAVIPYTYTHTNMQQMETGKVANIEFDLIGKYIARIVNSHKNHSLE